jgi:hypothetical protein
MDDHILPFPALQSTHRQEHRRRTQMVFLANALDCHGTGTKGLQVNTWVDDMDHTCVNPNFL